MKRRRIAFGWRGTLLPVVSEFETERGNPLAALVYRAQLRAGTRTLLKTLQKERWDICIYTLDLLPARRVRLFFALHGILLRDVITGLDHRAAFKDMHAPSARTKYPPAFGVDLIVDDKQETQEAGQRLGFATYLIPSGGTHWHTDLLSYIKTL